MPAENCCISLESDGQGSTTFCGPLPSSTDSPGKGPQDLAGIMHSQVKSLRLQAVQHAMCATGNVFNRQCVQQAMCSTGNVCNRQCVQQATRATGYVCNRLHAWV